MSLNLTELKKRLESKVAPALAEFKKRIEPRIAPALAELKKRIEPRLAPALAELKKRIEPRFALALAEVKKRLEPQYALALTLEPERMAVSLVRREEGRGGIGVQPLPGEALKSLSIGIGAEALFNNPEKAGAELASALEGAGIKERRCVVAIPPGWALTASAELPEISPEDLRGYFELRAEREFSISVADLRLAHCPYFLPDGTRRATLAAVPAKRLEAVEKTLAAAGCRARSISLAMEGCLADPQPMLHFFAGGAHTDVVVSAGGGIALLRSLAGLRPPDETPFDAAAFCREIRITLGRLPEPLRQAVRIARFSGDLAPELESATGEFLQRMGIQSRQSGEGAPGAAVESAKRQLRHEPVAFEFVVVEPSRWPAKLQWFDTRRGRWITGGAFSLMLLLLLVFISRSKTESRLQTEWNGIKAPVAELDLYQQKIRQFHPWFDHAPQDLKILDGFISAFPERGDVWAKTVQIMAPEQGDVWAKSGQAGAGCKINCSGFARSQPVLMAFLDRLRARRDFNAVQVQQLRGQNPIQFSLTCKWEPIHDK